MSAIGRRASGTTAVWHQGIEEWLEQEVTGEVVWVGEISRNLALMIIADDGRPHALFVSRNGNHPIHFEPERPDDGTFEYAEAEMLHWSAIADARRGS